MIGLSKPFKRIIRPFYTDGIKNVNAAYNYELSSDSRFFTDEKYASDRQELCRAYLLIIKDLLKLFEYIEPAENNLIAYSHRTYELLLRASTEFETNCKRILEENGYSSNRGRLGIKDFYKINQSSKLGSYEIVLKEWYPNEKRLQPFLNWKNGHHSLPWYQAYNNVKHDRHKNFQDASLENVLLATSGLYAILFSQFFLYTHNTIDVGYETFNDDKEILEMNSIFTVVPPNEWTSEECYNFEWDNIKNTSNPFETYQYS